MILLLAAKTIYKWKSLYKYISKKGKNLTETIAYKNQSTAKMRPMSSAGRLTAWRTSTMVTSPACGIPAAPIEAAVAVKLQEDGQKITFSKATVYREYMVT